VVTHGKSVTAQIDVIVACLHIETAMNTQVLYGFVKNKEKK
jgi:hypothetical protein